MSKVTAKGLAQFEANKHKGWTMDEWNTHAPFGIEAMEENDPQMFNMLYMQEYGVDLNARNNIRESVPNNSIKGKAKFEANVNRGWSWDEWQENAPEAMAYMEENRPDFFSALYQIEFGVTPKLSANTNNPASISKGSKSQFEANANKGFNWEKWQENAPEGLEYMEANNPNMFRDLYHAEFGVRLNIGTNEIQKNNPASQLPDKKRMSLQAAIKALEDGKGIEGAFDAALGDRAIQLRSQWRNEERRNQMLNSRTLGTR